MRFFLKIRRIRSTDDFSRISRIGGGGGRDIVAVLIAYVAREITVRAFHTSEFGARRTVVMTTGREETRNRGGVTE